MATTELGGVPGPEGEASPARSGSDEDKYEGGDELPAASSLGLREGMLAGTPQPRALPLSKPLGIRRRGSNGNGNGTGEGKGVGAIGSTREPPPPLMCEDGDTVMVTDASGGGCQSYSFNAALCGSLDDADFIAGALCCACGGGRRTCVRCTFCFCSSTLPARATETPLLCWVSESDDG